MLYGLSKTKEMLEHNYQRESSGCNSKCSMRSCATERVINKAGISGSCSCSIGFTVRQQPKTFFFLFTTLPVPSWKDVWSNCSPVYRPSGNDSIRFGRLYLLKQCGGIYYYLTHGRQYCSLQSYFSLATLFIKLLKVAE